MFSQLVVDFRTPSRSARLVTWAARLIWILLILLLVLIGNAVRARIVWLVGSWLIWIWLVWPTWLIWLRFQWLTDSTIRSLTLLPMGNNLSRWSAVLKRQFRIEYFIGKVKNTWIVQFLPIWQFGKCIKTFFIVWQCGIWHCCCWKWNLN